MEVGKNILGIEGEVAWATPGAFTIHNFPCAENGSNCHATGTITSTDATTTTAGAVTTQYYQDPSLNVDAARARLLQYWNRNNNTKKKIPTSQTPLEKKNPMLRVG